MPTAGRQQRRVAAMDHLIRLIHDDLCVGIDGMDAIRKAVNRFLLALPRQSRLETICHDDCIIVSKETHHFVGKPPCSNHAVA